jgi:hypothetical protein
MTTQTPTMDQERPITLREEELLKRGQHLAQQLAVRDGLVEEKKAEAKKRQEEIDELDAEISKIASQIRDGFENRRQGDLFIDQALPKDKAAATLIDIAKRAELHPFVGAPGVGCTRDGCGRLADNEVHRPPTPSEPHTYVPDGSGEGKCWACGSNDADPVHAAPAPAEAPAEAVTEPAMITCSRCEKTVPKSDVVYDGEVKPVCETCKRVGISAGTWPHEFRTTSPKAKRCADCKHPKDDAVHEAAGAGAPPVEPTPEEAQAVAERQAASGDPAYDFPDNEPPPNVIRSHAAIDVPATEPDEEAPPAECVVPDEDDDDGMGQRQ